MQDVAFHHGMADKLAYACRLVRKAYRAGAITVVTADADTLRQFDRQLWVFDEQEFLPHVCVTEGKAWPARWQDTPIWLTDQPEQVPVQRHTLVNLGAALPAGLNLFEKFFDVVSSEPQDRAAGRQRWRQYEAMGLRIQAHHAQD
jgi:DNA polymerase-3 subunit chi